jgi:uncharacterized membrane protein YqjE
MSNFGDGEEGGHVLPRSPFEGLEIYGGGVVLEVEVDCEKESVLRGVLFCGVAVVADFKVCENSIMVVFQLLRTGKVTDIVKVVFLLVCGDCVVCFGEAFVSG